MPPSPLRAGLIGRTLADSYVIERKLGGGGMGVVYVARHTRLPARFAVKVLHAELGQSEELFHRFRHEAELLSSLRHPNIVQVTDYNRLPDGTMYLVMEYLQGEDLQLRLATRQQLPFGEALHLGRQMGAALIAAHKNGIVHRDLKPQNLFLSQEDHGTEVVEILKVLDFGVSKVRRDGEDQLTNVGRILGTPQFMAPEQARGHSGDVDWRADQFSMAAILYYAISGKLPFRGPDSTAVLYQVLYQMPPPLHEIAVVPPALSAALERAMDKDPDRRFSSMVEFLGALLGEGTAGTWAGSGPRPARLAAGQGGAAAAGWATPSEGTAPAGGSAPTGGAAQAGPSLQWGPAHGGAGDAATIVSAAPVAEAPGRGAGGGEAARGAAPGGGVGAAARGAAPGGGAGAAAARGAAPAGGAGAAAARGAAPAGAGAAARDGSPAGAAARGGPPAGAGAVAARGGSPAGAGGGAVPGEGTAQSGAAGRPDSRRAAPTAEATVRMAVPIDPEADTVGPRAMPMDLTLLSGPATPPPSFGTTLSQVSGALDVRPRPRGRSARLLVALLVIGALGVASWRLALRSRPTAPAACLTPGGCEPEPHVQPAARPAAPGEGRAPATQTFVTRLPEQGAAALRAGDLDGARRAFEQSLQAGEGAAYAGLGEVELEAHNFTAAARWLREAVEREPEQARSWLLLCQARYRLGDRVAARTACQRVLQLAPGQTDAQMLLRGIGPARK